MVAESDSALTSSTVSELAEARRTTYLSGRWIWDDQNGETSISITGAPVSLPSNGDCSAYYTWVEEKSTNQGPGMSFCPLSEVAVVPVTFKLSYTFHLCGCRTGPH